MAAGELSAFDLIKEGDKYVGEQAKDKVVQIRSEKSVGSLVPDIWYVVYYDPTATLKATEVKFGGGKMMEVKRPLRLLEPVTGGDQTLERKKLKVDSNRALALAMKEPLLQNLNVRATQFWLEHAPGGPVCENPLLGGQIEESQSNGGHRRNGPLGQNGRGCQKQTASQQRGLMN